MISTSKINKLNSLFIQSTTEMKKVIYSAVIVSLCILSTTSCKKYYRCNCSYNNKVVFTKDLGGQYETKAQEECSSYDTTIVGEVWNCSIY
jgi:hypothetical protein